MIVRIKMRREKLLIILRAKSVRIPIDKKMTMRCNLHLANLKMPKLMRQRRKSSLPLMINQLQKKSVSVKRKPKTKRKTKKPRKRQLNDQITVKINSRVGVLRWVKFLLQKG